jgi:hypothetical protein
VQVRIEAFNVLNRVQFGVPNTQVGNSNFGVVSSQANAPRQVQFALKLIFRRRRHSWTAGISLVEPATS